MERHFNGILHIDEVAHLAAIGVFRLVAFEEPNAAGFLNLIEGFADEAAHVAFVIFIRAENIEILNPNDVRQDFFA